MKLRLPKKKEKDPGAEESRMYSLEAVCTVLGSMILIMLVAVFAGIFEEEWYYIIILFLGMAMNIVLALLFSMWGRKKAVAWSLVFSLVLAVLQVSTAISLYV